MKQKGSAQALTISLSLAIFATTALAAETPAKCKSGSIASFCQAKGTGDPTCANPVTLPTGLKPSENPYLLETAVKEMEKGGLCCGQVATVDQPATVYRAWAAHYEDKNKQPPGYYPSYQFGNWWSPTPPPASRAAYRHMDDICREWDSLTVFSKCQLRVGTQVVVGPGQSACCAQGELLPQSDVLQIYVPNYGGLLGSQGWLDNCDTYVWPPGSKQ